MKGSSKSSTPVEPVSDADRLKIATANARLHRETADLYDGVHPHMVNGFEQRMQREDIATMCRECGPAAAPRGCTVLDVGCGTGNLTLQFLARGADVTALDMSAEMLAVLRRKVERAGYAVTIVNQDVESYIATCARTFDIISLSSVLHHLPDYLTVARDLTRHLSPGGWLYLAHEPVHVDEVRTAWSLARRTWSAVPRAINRVQTLASGHAGEEASWHERDTDYADYHYYRGGISLRAIEVALETHGTELRSLRHYNAHRSNLASWIDNVWFSALRWEQPQRTYFRAMFRRRAHA